MKQIIDIQLRGPDEAARGAEDPRRADRRGQGRCWSREGYDPTYGARPLKRTIQRRVLDPLALRVLEGDFGEGDTVVVDAGDGGLDVRKARSGAGA